MKITNVKIVMPFDLSGLIRYSALVNGKTLVQHTSDNVFHKHLTREEWIDSVKTFAKEEITS